MLFDKELLLFCPITAVCTSLITLSGADEVCRKFTNCWLGFLRNWCRLSVTLVPCWRKNSSAMWSLYDVVLLLSLAVLHSNSFLFNKVGFPVVEVRSSFNRFLAGPGLVAGDLLGVETEARGLPGLMEVIRGMLEPEDGDTEAANTVIGFKLDPEGSPGGPPPSGGTFMPPPPEKENKIVDILWKFSIQYLQGRFFIHEDVWNKNWKWTDWKSRICPPLQSCTGIWCQAF